MKSIRNLRVLFIFLIVAAAFILRFYNVTTNPPALNWDEVSIGYNAYSILKTGRDEWGQLLPLHFKSYGEYKLPMQIYASIPGIMLFGLTELGVRITPVVYGTLTVLLLYFLAKELFKDEKVALISALMLAISPWHIQLTRASFESSFSVLWVVLGIWMLVRGLERKNKKWWLISAVSFVGAVYTYNAARVFVPLFLFVIFIIYQKKFLVNKKVLLLSVLIFLASLLPLIPFTLSGEVAYRLNLVSIFSDPGLTPRLDEARNISTLPPVINKLVNNRYTYLSYYFVRNYLAHFTPDFLFINGAGHRQHHVQGVGEMYLVQAPFVLAGLYFLFKKRFKYRYLIISWILLAFIPVAVTRDSIPHALRTLIAAPAYQILTAFGFVEGLVLAKKRGLQKIFTGLTLVTLIIAVVGFAYNLYYVYPLAYSKDWQYGYKQVVGYIGEHYDKYDKIVFSRHYGEPHMFTLFYLAWDPADFRNDPNLNRFETFDWIRVLSFDKFYFPDLGDKDTTYDIIRKENPRKKLLYIGKPGDFPADAKKLKEVHFLNGEGAFEIVEVD